VLKKILQMSALASVLALGIALPASAANEEDAAAPLGSFTADMPAPVGPRAQDHALRHHMFERRERLEHRASLERPGHYR
jgi:hypothetical protein